MKVRPSAFGSERVELIEAWWLIGHNSGGHRTAVSVL